MSWVTTLQTHAKYPKRDVVEKDRRWRALEALPVAIPVFTLVFGAVALLLLVGGMLWSWLVVLLGVPLGSIAAWYVGGKVPNKLPGSLLERRWVGLALLVGVAAWVGVNMVYASETVYVYKDPGIYTTSAKFISQHDNLIIETSDVFGEDPKINGDSAGYESVRGNLDRLYVQAPHLVPVIAGLFARLVGETGVFAANSMLGGVALLSMYGFMRTFIKPRWAVLGVWVLGMSLPMIYFSRDLYTEPLAMAFILSTMTLMGMAYRQQLRSLWFFTGLFAAGGLMARADTWIPLAGFIGVFLLLQLGNKLKQQQIDSNFAWFLLGLGVSGTVAQLDMIVLSYKYFLDTVRWLVPLMTIVLGLFVVGYIFIRLDRRFSIVESVNRFVKRWLPAVGAVAIALVFVVIASRPLWLVSTKQKNNDGYVAYIQELNGEEIAPKRNYAELSFNWIVWYLGIVVAVLSVAGIAVAVHRHLKGKDLPLLPLTIPFLAMGIFYLLLPGITPDQIWASRRFLPIIFPGFAIFGIFFLQWLYENQKARLPKFNGVVLVGVLGLLIVGPLWNTETFIRSKEVAGFRVEIDRICGALFDDSAVLMVGSNGRNMTQSLKAYCDVPVQNAAAPTTDQYRAAREAALANGYEPVVISVGYEWPRLPEGSGVTPISFITFTELDRTLSNPPQVVNAFDRTIHMSYIAEDGTLLEVDVEALEARQAEEGR